MKKTIIFDIDGTLANLDHRLHFVNDPKHKNWEEFLARVKDDLPIEQTIFLNNILRPITTFDIVLSSGRSENERADTEEWLAKYGVHYDKMYMRPAGDTRADYVVKREMLDQMREDGRDPWLVFDDRQTVVDMWRKEGLFVLQCAAKETFLDQYQFHKDMEYPLTIMVGPSGAGKSTHIANTLHATGLELHGMVISSDAIRDMVTGDFRDQSQNQRVHEAMHQLAKERLRLGLPVVLDATHIRTADRVKAAKLLPESHKVLYVVVDRPLDVKRQCAGWRTGVMVKDKPLVDYHHQVMQANLKAILNGDGLPNVTVKDLRS
jgi:predicted kinase